MGGAGGVDCELDSHCGVCTMIRVTTICGGFTEKTFFLFHILCVCAWSVNPQEQDRVAFTALQGGFHSTRSSIFDRGRCDVLVGVYKMS